MHIKIFLWKYPKIFHFWNGEPIFFWKNGHLFFYSKINTELFDYIACISKCTIWAFGEKHFLIKLLVTISYEANSRVSGTARGVSRIEPNFGAEMQKPSVGLWPAIEWLRIRFLKFLYFLRNIYSWLFLTKKLLNDDLLSLKTFT